MINERELRSLVENRAKNTIGYKEAANKESFMVGVSVATSFCLEELKSKIESSDRLAVQYQKYSETLEEDLKALASIINRYSNND